MMNTTLYKFKCEHHHYEHNHDFYHTLSLGGLGIWSTATLSVIIAIADSSDKVGTIGIYRLPLP